MSKRREWQAAGAHYRPCIWVAVRPGDRRLMGCSMSERWEQAVARPRPAGGTGTRGKAAGGWGWGRERKAAAIERRLKEEGREEED